MASSKKTANIRLNQWIATDQVLREDLNVDNNRIDSAIGERALVRMGRKTLTASVTSHTFDLSIYTMTNFFMLELYICPLVTIPDDSSGNCAIALNGAEYISLGPASDDGSVCYHIEIIPGYGGTTYGVQHSIINWRAIGSDASGCEVVSGINMANLTSITVGFTGGNGSDTYNEYSRFRLYGIAT